MCSINDCMKIFLVYRKIRKLDTLEEYETCKHFREQSYITLNENLQFLTLPRPMCRGDPLSAVNLAPDGNAIAF